LAATLLPHEYFPTCWKACNYCSVLHAKIACNNCTWNHGLTAIFLYNSSKPIPECHHSGFYCSKDDGDGGYNWSYTKCAKLQSNCHHQQTNTQLCTGRIPFLSPNQQCQSTDSRKLHVPQICLLQAHLGELKASFHANILQETSSSYCSTCMFYGSNKVELSLSWEYVCKKITNY